MNKKIIDDITDFIFVSDEPQEADIVFLPGGSNPLPPEMAATLYKRGYAPLLLPSGFELRARVMPRQRVESMNHWRGGAYD